MDSASSFLSEDQFLCSVCLDVFTEPVSIPCGHNFCKACITRHWEGKDQYQCPLCNEKFNKGLKLRVNTGFREVVENFKKHLQETSRANNDFLVKPGQVPCDCCIDNKFKASKTCLVCLASYCEAHLEPHQRVAALKRHKLTDPVQNLEKKICKKHDRILELFCRTDQTQVCVLCTEHIAHDTVPLEESYADKTAQTEQKKAEVQETKQKGRTKAQKKKAARQNKQRKRQGEANTELSDQMQLLYIWWFLNELNKGPHNINRYSYPPQNRGFSEGRFCFEVHTEGRTGWDLGVVRESMIGKMTFTPYPRNGAWIIRLGSNNICRALHNHPVCLRLIQIPQRVLVFVDYESGLVSFFDADNGVLIYSFTGCRFKERLFLFFGPSPTEDVGEAQGPRSVVQMKNIGSCFLNALLYYVCVIWHIIASVFS